MNQRIQLFGANIDPFTMPQAVDRLMEWVDDKEAKKCRYVVTPNVDHTRLLQESEGLRNAYDDASMVLADGMPVVLASRLLRRPLPERVTGADLVPALFAAATKAQPLRVFLLGAMPGVAEKAAANIEEKWPAVTVAGLYSPPFGFEKDDAENQKILEMIAAAKVNVVVLGLGAPKQELWIHKHQSELQADMALCVGATIDFLAGEKPRAPQWMQKSGLEWLHRVASEPKRLLKRYVHDAWVFPQLVWREWRGLRSTSR